MGTEARADLRVILFDGVCNLCNGSVNWVIARDPQERFQFASLQSQAAEKLLHGVIDEQELADLPDSIVLVDAAGAHVRSTAALRIAAGMGLPYSLARVFFAIPRPLRDLVYNWVARNRYRWFGRQESCMLPTPDLASRFLDADEPR